MSFLDKLHSTIVKGLPAYNALKDIPFPDSGSGNSPVIIFPSINAISDAVLRLTTPGSQPSSDPNLSSLVHAGITWLSNTLPEPDLLVKREFQRKKGGKSRDDDVVEKHPIYDLFERPNQYTSGSTLWKAFAYSWIVAGNVYFLKFRDRFGRVTELWYEPHFTIRARWVNDKQGEYIPGVRSQSGLSIPRNDNPDQFINYYELDRGGQRFRIEPADVIHFRDGIDPYSPRYGLSRMTTILREIYGDSAMASYGANLLAGNGVIPYVLGIDDKEGILNQEDLDNIKTKLIEQTTGANTGKPLVLTSRMSFNRTGLSPQELDLRNSRYMAQEIFSMVTGIPPQVLNSGAGLEKSIYNNMQQADRRAVDQYLQPLWWHIAQELTHQLLPDIDDNENHFVEFDLSEVGALQEDENERWKRFVDAYQGQVIKRSEVRTELGFEVDPDGGDDVYLVRSGTAVETLEEEADARLNPEPQQIPGQPLQIAGQQKLLTGASPIIKELFSAE